MDFPIFKTKIENSPRFDLTDSCQRQDYFKLKAGREIERLREYLEKNTFIAYILGKKVSGKGTYAKMFKEVVAPDKIEHFSIGDMIREFDELVKDKKKRKELISFLEENYRGYLPLDGIIKSLEQRSTKTLLSSELILALAKREISKKGRKALFIDGFPRGLDQISYSLFFRDLIDYRDDPDFFVLVDVPDMVIDERIKYRVVCPVCQTSRNLKLLRTKEVGYDQKEGKFYLVCDNSECRGSRMIQKEGDQSGIEPIRERLKQDEALMRKAFSLYGLPKILLRNCLPINKAKEFVDDYELTPEYSYEFNEESGRVTTIEKPWQVIDDERGASYSLLPPPVVVSLIKQLAKCLSET